VKKLIRKFHLVTPWPGATPTTTCTRAASLTRAIPAVQDAELFGWLRGLYPIWAGLTPEMVQVSTQVAMAELLLSGCTTSSDHLYIYPNGVRLDDSIEAAQQIGMRFVATRGSMSVGQSTGGLPPDRVVENEDAILKDTQRLIERYHDAAMAAMVNVAVAPCSPFSVSRDLMRESAALARATRCACTPTWQKTTTTWPTAAKNSTARPPEYAQDLGWLGHDVWHAHCVKLDDRRHQLFAATRTGVAHCPCSNMRLASRHCPVRKMLDAGVPVGLGVDGSASNDAAHMVNEARQAMLLARVGRACNAPRNGAPMPHGERTHLLGCDLSASSPEMTARDTLCTWPPGAAHRCWAAATRAATSPPACAQTWQPVDLRTLGHLPVAPCMTRWGSLLLCASPRRPTRSASVMPVALFMGMSLVTTTAGRRPGRAA
jgi:8-oxoguanine deaminase